MKKLWDDQTWDDYLNWQRENPKILIRINELIKSIERTPFSGIGKPEPLKNNLKGFWSRRINQEHRLVYTVKENTIYILQCKFHY